MAELIISKFCVLCQTEKPASEYYQRKDRSSPSRLYKFCKQCARQEFRDLYALKQEAKGRSFKRYGARSVSNPESLYKRCSNCQTYKGKEHFHKHKGRVDGLHDWCKACHKKRNDGLKAKRDAFAALPKEIPTEKQCTKCKVIKSAAYFFRDKHCVQGLSSQCKPCIKVSPKRQKTEQHRGAKQKYACTNCGKVMWRRTDYKQWRGLCRQCLQPRDPFSPTAERRKIIGKGIYKDWRKAVLERDAYMCQFCGSMEQLEADHIKPWATHPELRYDVANGRTLCRPCHQKTDTYGGRGLKRKAA